MAGLTNAGFEKDSLEEIVSRIRGKLDAINPGFDFSPDSPDGQLVDIMAYEIFTLWSQLSDVYNSYDPDEAQGSALRNIGLITGIPYGNADRSYATIELQGTTGTVIPKNSQVSDADGNIFYFAFQTTIPSNAQVICETAGPIVVDANTITTIVTPVTGWTGITQTTDGVIGRVAQTPQEYRNLRTATVMRNGTSVADTMQARLLETGILQATVFNNDDTITVDGVPANTIRVTVGEVGDVTDDTIASVIFETNAAGCPTFGTTTVAITDTQGFPHDINFVKATGITIKIVLDVTYLDEESAGAEEQIKTALLGYINNLLSGEDVIYSHLYQYITPYGKAQVNTLTIHRDGDSPGVINLPISDIEYATMVDADITFSVT